MPSLEFALLLIGLGFIAGIINTLAGGGSNLTLPALMLMGLPADVANGTNRVGVLLQSVSGVFGFWRKKSMPTQGLGSILAPTLLGGLAGALLASFLALPFLKPALLITMVVMSLVILFQPSPKSHNPEDAVNSTVTFASPAWWGLFAAGIYGGFVQAGVGFVLLGALCGLMRLDLIRANALKMLCAGAFTAVALLVFAVRDQIAWIPGLLLAVGSVVGAQVGVRLALSISPKALKWCVFLMTLCACAAALLK